MCVSWLTLRRGKHQEKTDFKTSFIIHSCFILDLEWVSKVRVNTQAVLKRAQQIQGRKVAKKQWQVNSLLYFLLYVSSDTSLLTCIVIVGCLAAEGRHVHWSDDACWWWYTFQCPSTLYEGHTADPSWSAEEHGHARQRSVTMCLCLEDCFTSHHPSWCTWITDSTSLCYLLLLRSQFAIMQNCFFPLNITKNLLNKLLLVAF